MTAIVKGPLQKRQPAFIQLALAHDEQEFYVQFSTFPGAEASTDPSVYWAIDARDGLGLWNTVCGTRFGSSEADRRISAVLALCFACGIPSLMWTVMPGDRPSDLGMRLAGFHGLQHSRRENMMAVDLDALSAVDQRPHGLRVERAATESALREWVHVAGYAFAPVTRDRARAVNLDKYRHVALKQGASLQLFVGRVRGQPVGASALFTGGGVASIHDVVTDPEWEHRGIGTAMTATALEAGRSLGMQIGALTSEHTGPSLYSRLGYREFGALRKYEWTRERALRQRAITL